MADIKWVKLATDIFDNRKIKHLRRLPDGDRLTLIWIMLITVAGRANMGGGLYLTEGLPYTAEMLADELGFEEDTVARALETMEQLHMLEEKRGVLRVVGWEEHQSVEGLEKIKEQNRLRKQRQREKIPPCDMMSRDMSRDSHVTEGVTSHVTVTQCHATEEEEEKEKEYHSFFHSQKTQEEKYVEKKVSESGFEGKDAEDYRKQLRENLKMKYLGGNLGQYRIFISDEQFEDLCERLSVDEIEKYFNIVAECERAGKRYKRKSHYQAILEMATHDRRLL